jgi:hypothetical protein
VLVAGPLGLVLDAGDGTELREQALMPSAIWPVSACRSRQPPGSRVPTAASAS